VARNWLGLDATERPTVRSTGTTQHPAWPRPVPLRHADPTGRRNQLATSPFAEWHPAGPAFRSAHSKTPHDHAKRTQGHKQRHATAGRCRLNVHCERALRNPSPTPACRPRCRRGRFRQNNKRHREGRRLRANLGGASHRTTRQCRPPCENFFQS
jgi:hypothetical protein